MLKVEVVLWNPKMAVAILAQGESLDNRVSGPEATLSTVSKKVHARHLTSKAFVLVFKKKAWGVIGSFSKQEKTRVGVRVVLLRANWARRGRELDAIKHSD